MKKDTVKYENTVNKVKVFKNIGLKRQILLKRHQHDCKCSKVYHLCAKKFFIYIQIISLTNLGLLLLLFPLS